MSTKYTIKPILTGWQYLDKGLYATYRDGLGTILQHPVFAWLIEGSGHKYLVDTGMASTEISQKYHHDGRQDPGTAIHEQLAKMGVATDEIEAILFTHLHWDHCYNMKEFKKARYITSDVEYAFAMDPIPPYWGSYEHEKAGLTPPFKGCKFELVSGEQEIFDGIRIVPIPGHSPGHIAVSIDTEKGDYWIIGDLMLVRENLQPDLKHGWPLTPPGRFSNFVELWHSMEKVVARADFILMTHDITHLDVPIYPIPQETKKMIPLALDSPFRKFYAENYRFDPDDYITLEYYFETGQNPYEVAAHLCQEQSTAQWKRVGVDEDFRELFASKVISLEQNTQVEWFRDDEKPGEEERTRRGWWVKIAYPHRNFGARIPNLLTSLCGEGTFHSPGMQTIKLMDVHFPDVFLAQFDGPRFGIQGIRDMLEVYDRPLSLGVIKPNIGLPTEPFAELGYKAWLGGLDIAKDDELLCDIPTNPFEKRCALLGDLRRKAEAETGHKKIYLANITDEVDRMLELYEIALQNSTNAVMINGMTTGLSIVRVLAKKGKLPLFSHFDFIAPFTQMRTFGVHLKVITKLQRLAGFDGQIYQGLGSRMHTSSMDVIQAFQACTEPMGPIKASLPIPAGSQWAGSFQQLFELFGSRDFAIVPGRAVFSHPMGPAAGATALQQGWEAAEKGVSLDEYAATHEELRQAILMN